jgi:hypothetical protein
VLAQTIGCTWTGLTVSKQQLGEAVARVKAAGLSDSITLLFCDYRECIGLGPFDKVCLCVRACLGTATAQRFAWLVLICHTLLHA